jgi:hypothetical protein
MVRVFSDMRIRWTSRWLRIFFNMCRRAIMPFLMRLSRRIYPRYDGSYHIFRIGRRTVMKSGRHVRLTEASTMRYIATHTSIPVPKVLDAWALSNGGASILMEWVEGADTLEHRWPLMSDVQKKSVFLQLKGFVDELRALDQPSEKQGWIGPLDGAPLWDDRVKSQPCGPFPSERSFNQFRLSLLIVSSGKRELAKVYVISRTDYGTITALFLPTETWAFAISW